MRLIDADALIEDIREHSASYFADDFAHEWVDQQPTIEPERKRGKWQITDAYPHNVYCSECHTRFAQTHWAVWEDGSLPRNFCPNCGADLRGDDHDQSK